MNPIRLCTLSILAAAALAACSTTPPVNPALEQARGAYRDAQANGKTQALAPAELKQAGEALARAESSFERRDDTNQVNQLSYLARQRVSLAVETAGRKDSEATVIAAGAARDQLRLAARTQEADQAARQAEASSRDAASSQRQSEAAQRQSEAAQRQSMASRQQAADATQQAAAANQQAAAAQQAAAHSQMQAGDAERRAQALEMQLRELNAKKTERGLVITIGDVLFDTNRAELKSGGMRNIERLSGFLKEYPQRTASIEGYTDSVGSDDHNLALSARRTDAVRSALLAMGVGRGQLATQGYGESHPVAGNDSAGGRQMNRRVEIVLSDEGGVVAPR